MLKLLIIQKDHANLSSKKNIGLSSAENLANNPSWSKKLFLKFQKMFKNQKTFDNIDDNALRQSCSSDT